LTLYSGIAIVFLAVWRGLSAKRREQPLSFGPIHFVNSTGLKLAGLGSAIQAVAGIWNEIVHHVLLTEPKIAPAHALLVVGILTVNLGMIVGLSVEYGMIRREILVVSTWKRWATYVSMSLIFSSIWLAAAGSLIYTARILRGNPFDWTIAALLSVVVTFILVPAKRAMPEFGSATIIGIIFNSIAYFFLVIYLGDPAYVPWGIIPLITFDILIAELKRVVRLTHAIVIASAVVGLLFYAVYFPFTSYLFPWVLTPQLPVVIIFIGSLVGAWAGYRVYRGLSALVLGSLE
jgi:hypothetical protein